MSQVVDFKAFSRLMKRRGLTEAALATRFRGKIDEPREFFSRVVQGRYADVVIPYKSVLQFYRSLMARDKQKCPPQPSESVDFYGGVFSPPLG